MTFRWWRSSGSHFSCGNFLCTARDSYGHPEHYGRFVVANSNDYLFMQLFRSERCSVTEMGVQAFLNNFRNFRSSGMAVPMAVAVQHCNLQLFRDRTYFRCTASFQYYSWKTCLFIYILSLKKSAYLLIHFPNLQVSRLVCLPLTHGIQLELPFPQFCFRIHG